MDKNIVALVREDTKTVNVKFFPSKYTNYEDVIPNAMAISLEELKCYKYVTTLDLVPGDLCMVQVGQRPEVVEVQSVDEALAIEPNSNVKYKWVLAKIDRSYMDTLLEQNKELEAILEEGYRKNTRRQFRDVFMASVDHETQGRLLALTTKKVG